jgi:signal transduction histidine kinase
LVNMRDRLDAVGGTVTIVSRPGDGTTVTAVVPRPAHVTPLDTVGTVSVRAV